MQHPPTPEEVRALVRPLDDRDRKVLGGLVALMIREPGEVRDPEWLAERFVEVAVVAHGFQNDEEHATTEDVQTIERYAKDRMPALVHAAMALFVRTAEELRATHERYTFRDAQEIVARYVAGG